MGPTGTRRFPDRTCAFDRGTQLGSRDLEGSEADRKHPSNRQKPDESKGTHNSLLGTQSRVQATGRKSAWAKIKKKEKKICRGRQKISSTVNLLGEENHDAKS